MEIVIGRDDPEGFRPFRILDLKYRFDFIDWELHGTAALH
jgi:hypothetical protein